MSERSSSSVGGSPSPGRACSSASRSRLALAGDCSRYAVDYWIGLQSGHPTRRDGPMSTRTLLEMLAGIDPVLKNDWHIVARSDDVPEDRTCGTRLLGQP